MRQIRLGLVVVWLAACGSSNTPSIDAPSPDAPVSGDARVADARAADARAADAPSGGGVDAPAGGGVDAPVVMADAPVVMADAPVVMADAPSAPDAMTSLCGNGVVDIGESCDTAIVSGEGACPTSCTETDVDLCTTATLTGAGTCQAACSSQAVAATNNDGLCCPPGGTMDNDNDCVNTAFRINSLVLEDPHVYTNLLSGGASCDDITTTVNGAINGDLNGDGNHDDELDLSPVVLFKPLNDKAGETTPINLVLATCTAPADTSTCSATNSSTRFTGTTTNSAADATGACLDVIEGTHNDAYGDIVTPEPACTSAPFGTVTLNVPVSVPFGGGSVAATLVLVLEDVQAASTYHPSGTLGNDTIQNGMLRGFLTKTSAGMNGTSFLDTPFGKLPLAQFLSGGADNCKMANPGDTDTDENASDHAGWYFYLTFEAVKTPYAETP